MNRKYYWPLKMIVPAFLSSFLYIGQAEAHGYIQSPASRAYLCQQQVNVNCGAVEYEPQSLEGPKGFPVGGPPDGHIASAGNTQFFPLDEQKTDRWRKVNISSDLIRFSWKLTAEHATESWDYFITKPGWDENSPLTRADFDRIPFCHYDGEGKIPKSPVEQQCQLPADRNGYNVILGIWSIADTSNAFYQVVDVNIQQ